MSLPRDTLLFSIVLMLWAVQVEASGYGTSGLMVLASLVVGLIGLVGSFLSSLITTDRSSASDATG